MDSAVSRAELKGSAGRIPEPLPDGLGLRGLLRRAGQLAAFAVLTGLLITTLPGLSDVRDRFSDARPGWLAPLVVLELASCLAFVAVFRGVFCTRLTWRFCYQIALASQATNVLLPAGGVGGLALGAWVLRQGGMSGARIARRSVAFFIITSIPNFAGAAVFGLLLGFGVLAGSGPHALTFVMAGLATATIAVVLLIPRIVSRFAVSDRLESLDARGIARARQVLHRGAVAASAGVEDVALLLRTRQPGVVSGAVGYMAFDVAALAAAFAALGTVPPLAAFVFAYVLGQLGGLIPVPGGIGGTDGGLIAALTLYGSPLAQSTAAVLAYRSMQLGIPAILGSVAFIQLRRTLARGGAPAALCDPLPGPLPVVTLPAR